MTTIGIIGAMQVEIDKLITLLDLKKEDSKDIYIKETVDKRIVVSSSGVGKVNSALMTQYIINKYDVDVETCGEGAIQDIPCLSQKDINILGLQDEITLSDKKGQRSTCSCPSNKKELITGQKPTRCDNKCLYCYWKD